MKGIQFRWALPMFHLAVDLTLVAFMVAAANSEPELQRMIRSGQMVIDTPPCPACRLLAASTPPASIIASQFVTGGSEEIGWRPIGWRWFGLFEAVAIPFWFLLGWLAEHARAGILWWCLILTAIRILALPLLWSRYRGAGWSLEVLFWLGATIYTISASLWWLAERMQSRWRKDADPN
jgi:hypothetical protein